MCVEKRINKASGSPEYRVIRLSDQAKVIETEDGSIRIEGRNTVSLRQPGEDEDLNQLFTFASALVR
jgi:hypothetical protein